MKQKTSVSQNLSLDQIREQIVGINQMVPVFDGSEKPYIFLDNAASTPVLRPVMDTINEFMPFYSSVHRGSGHKSLVSTHAYDDARQIVGEFFGANSSEHIVIFGKNTTEAINKLSYRLQLSKKDIVLIGMMEHHSNDLPWRRMSEVHRIKTDGEGNLIDTHLDELLEHYKGRVKLVAISGGSNVTGTLPDINSIAKKAHANQAQILVDCAQLAPHRKIDIKELSDPEHLDYITVSAHKMYAPFGIGALIGRKDTFEVGEPELCGGGTINVVTTDFIDWAAPPDRDEAGSPNVVGAIAMAKAIKVLSTITMPKIIEHETTMTSYALRELSKIAGIEIIGNKDPKQSHKRLGVIPFKINNIPDALVAAILSTEWGIGIRNGCFCAHPYVTQLLNLSDQEILKFKEEVVGGDRSHIPGVGRISFGMYNTIEEIDTLVLALKQITKGAHQANYQQDKSTGDYSAVGWEPNLRSYFTI